MNQRLQKYGVLYVVLIAGLISAVAQTNSAAGTTPVRMTVTVEAIHGKEVPTVYKEDVFVHQDKDRLRVLDWIPAQDGRARLELFLLLDDSSDISVGTNLDGLRDFVKAQAASTAIGVGYMSHGTVTIAQNFTTDHALAAKALRLPLGAANINTSPYLAVAELIKRWPADAGRKAIVMVTDGIDRLDIDFSRRGFGSNYSRYVDTASDEARKAGIPVFSIYTPTVGRLSRSFWLTSNGQASLSRLSDATGGDAYYLGVGTPVSFKPYLDEIQADLSRQYILVFEAKMRSKAGFQRVKISTEVPNAELEAADSVWVPAAAR